MNYLMAGFKHSSKYDGYPDYSEYGNTYNIDGWSVEPTAVSMQMKERRLRLFPNSREMLKEMKSLFDWSEDNFGTNNPNRLHIQ